LDTLKRIIKYDKVSDWSNTPGRLAIIKVLEDCMNGSIKVNKLYDEKGDKLYGNDWPLPLNFTRKNSFLSRESNKAAFTISNPG
jgi:hypothetical protein